MSRPFAVVERDASIEGWEVATGVDDGTHTNVLIYYLDGGVTVVGLLSDDDTYSETAYDKDGKTVPNPIVRVPTLAIEGKVKDA